MRTIATRRPTNPLALAVLTLLTEQPMHPYEMSNTLKERRKEASIKLNYGSLYSVVDSLERRGLIEVREVLREGGRPQRTVYAITEAGDRLMTEWLSELLSSPAKEFPQFEAALSLMMVLPVDDVVPLLEQRLARLRATHAADAGFMTTAAEAGMPRVFGIEHEYELALLAAEIDFLAALLDDIHAGSFSGLDLWRRYHELRAAGWSRQDMETMVQDEFADQFAWVDAVSGLGQPPTGGSGTTE